MLRQQSLLRRLCRIAEIILTIYLKLERKSIAPIIDQFRDLLSQRLATRGLEDMISFVKTNRNAILRWQLGRPLSGAPGLNLDETGFPKEFLFLQGLMTSTEGLRAVLTLLTLTRAFHLTAAPDLSTITDPWSGRDTILSDDLKDALSKLGIKRGRVKDWSFPHMSTKRGPQGQAILSSLSELTLLPRYLIDNIVLLGGKSLGDTIEQNLEGLDILEMIKPKAFIAKEALKSKSINSMYYPVYFSVAQWWKWLFPPKSEHLRKLAYFGDKEGKVRVIAILDYWSQSCLRPLHDHINMILKRIPTDMTFNQGAFTKNLPSTPPGGNSFHSIDLSAATDRMPVALQSRVVEHIYGSLAKADAWKNLLVGLPYNVKLPKQEAHYVVYAAGQPMGAYSSWPVMALTHHVIVQVAAYRAGVVSRKRLYTGYALLGDDLRIDHDLVAREYKILISELGMPYSEAKTHTSKDGFEFAKRWFYKGNEITGFSISGLLSVWKSYPQLLNFLDNQASHGWKLPFERHPDLILSLHKVIHEKNFIFNKTYSMIKLYSVFSQVRLIKSQNVHMESIHSVLLSYMGISLPANALERSAPDIINLMFAEAKRNLVEKDLYTFQKEAFKVNAKLWGFVMDGIKEARVDHATADFLKETLSVVLNWNNPIVLSLNRLIDRSTEFLMNYWDPDISDEFLFTEGLSKYNITKGVFSMRNSTSIMLAESAILKEFINVARDMSLGRYIIDPENSLRLAKVKTCVTWTVAQVRPIKPMRL